MSAQASRRGHRWKQRLGAIGAHEDELLSYATKVVGAIPGVRNFGSHIGRAEVADTARSIARAVAAGRLDPEKVDEKTFARHLYVPELGDADMLWRTSGEHRLSNYMLWQAAYAELVFTDILWPDVDRLALWKAIELFARRDRRFGSA